MERHVNQMLFHLGLNNEFIVNKIRRWDVLEYRQVIQWKLRREYRYTFKDIADYFGQDVSTPKHAYIKIESMKETDEKIKAIIAKFN